MSAVSYEWDVETVAPDGDVLDHDHDDNCLSRLLARRNELEAGTAHLVLVRDVNDEVDGVTDRTWAYVEDGQMPDEFEDGRNVPKRFLAEFATALKATGLKFPVGCDA